MSATPSQQQYTGGLTDAITGDAGLAGRVALSWALAGGFVAGGLLLVLSTAIGGGSASGIPVASTALFLIGAVAGFVHGGVLGLAGRPDSVGYGEAVRSIEFSALFAVPGLPVLWVTTLWTAMTPVAMTTGRFSVVVGAAVGWLFGLGALLWAAAEGRSALLHALRRWPEHRPGSVLVSLTFAILLVAFVVARPEIWWTDLEVSGFGAVLLAMGATFWIVIPLVVVLLHFLHQWWTDSPIWGR
jgi:hypothetical protein